MMARERLYKVLQTNGLCYHGGTREWSLPTRNEDGTWTPGEWMPAIVGELVPCKNGYHLCNAAQLLAEWLGPAIFEAEYRGDRVDANDKCVVREARLLRRLKWDERVARLFACDCAERVLPLYEERYPEDKRPRQAIEAARRFANGEATYEELAAAWAAAWASDWASAWASDWDAEREWQVDRLVQYLEGEVSDGEATED